MSAKEPISMISQYLETKDKYKDFILLYRLGDFYEMFFEDAQIASKVLELTLTSRGSGDGERAPMCGVPFHACDEYIAKLIENGYKVAICEQTDEFIPGTKLMKREVTRLITPGTVTDSSALTATRNNYLAALFVTEEGAGVCFSDVSTAQMHATYFKGSGFETELLTELYTYSPREIITNVDITQLRSVFAYITDRDIMYMSGLTSFFDENAVERYNVQFGNKPYKDDFYPAVYAAGASLGYIADTQKVDISFIKSIELYENTQYLEMDMRTRRNLELTETMITKDKKGSLLWVLDKTNTAMGARRLRSLIEHPLTNVKTIISRQKSVGELLTNFILREEIRETLANVLDLERLMTKIDYGSATARELRSIAQTIGVLPRIKQLLSTVESEELSHIWNNIDELRDVYTLINDAICDSPPFSVREGGMVRDGYSSTVDELRSIKKNGDGYVTALENREKEATGIRTLRIRNNKVFGYYIEVSNSFKEMVPENYIRKQTTVNGERYITEELKELETTILGASDKLNALEYSIFSEIRDKVAENSIRIRTSAAALAELDVFISLAEVAALNNYTCPEVDNSTVLSIKEGRHPVVERTVSDSYFVPNDAELDTNGRRVMLITGPNMAGKSTFMRQNALIVLMAQMGSFVPAKEARIGVVDKLFTRVGASDDLAAGQSTFMLEMQEVAYILDNATNRSFIIYDEIGRGTSTFDGMAIAKAVLEYTAGKKIGAKTMFATHYHELTDMEETHEGIVNYNVAVKKRGDDLIFLRKIVSGPTDESYGVEVAKLAGVPKEVVKRAKEILKGFEADGADTLRKPKREESEDRAFASEISIFDMCRDSVCESIRKTDINTLTPIEAMNLIFEWKKELN